MSTYTPTELQRLRMKRVTYNAMDVAKATDKTYYMLVDLSNLSGKWGHKAPGAIGGPKATAGIQLFGARLIARPANTADIYNINLGVVLKLNSTTSADIGLLSPASADRPSDIAMDLTVAGTTGKLLNTYASVTKATDVGVRSATNLVDPQGNNVLPQVGDLVFQVISNGNVAGVPTGNIEYFEATVWYDIF